MFAHSSDLLKGHLKTKQPETVLKLTTVTAGVWTGEDWPRSRVTEIIFSDPGGGTM